MLDMPRRALAAVAFAGGAGLAGCETNAAANAPIAPAAAPQTATKTVYVAAQTARCVGVAPMDCLQVRTSPSEPWQLWYSGIEGFDYRPGYEYQLEIAEHSVPNPPADGSSIRWVLKRVVRQQPR
ncbi:hypothetical protein WS73_26135 [Burkholderia savannae]|uniref:DUF4377 domain-containing protein n=1 Tax=Burkholderia savannae TaxID=1637837 RepID=UPI000763F6D1|nr:DUF4377 domain-containing protein [Burkholderia savannae]KWZ40787.1 hypothetical protein WS73_26135 [Burkholderia savannae]